MNRDQFRQGVSDYLWNLPDGLVGPYSIDVDSTDRFKALLGLLKKLDNIEGISDKKYWTMIGLTWESCDNLIHYREEVKSLFRSKRKFRQYLMSSAGQSSLNKLPEEITIFRGMTVDEFKSGDFGISWSLKKEVAEFFAKYFRNCHVTYYPKTICELKIKKSDVIAFFNGRNEEEIIYDYASHKNKIQMKPKRHSVKESKEEKARRIEMSQQYAWGVLHRDEIKLAFKKFLANEKRGGIDDTVISQSIK